MSRGVNKVILIGNLGNDPEARYLQSGVCVTEVSIATSEQWMDKDGEKQERTEWHRVVFWDKLAEIVCEYLTKGAKVYVEGSLQTEKYTDKDGVDRYTTKIKAQSMQMLGSPPGQQGGRGGDQSNQSTQGDSRRVNSSQRASGNDNAGYRAPGRGQAPGRGDPPSRGGNGAPRYRTRGEQQDSQSRAPSRNDDPFPEDD